MGGRSDEKGHGVVVQNKWYDDWIKDDVPSLTGKVAVVTGANSGTGFWAAAAMAGKGCTVVLACRNLAKADHARDEILELHPDATVDVMLMDNMDMATVRTFADEFNRRYDRLDYLLNNAGIMAQPYILSRDGHDVQFQTNHLSHFLLTKLLWKKMLETPGQSRIVQHSSLAHRIGSPIFDRSRMRYPSYNWGWFGFNFLLVRIVFPLMGMSPIDRWLRYGVSKLSNVLFMRSLQHRIQSEGLAHKVISVACHPGHANTNLQYRASDAMRNWELKNAMTAQSAADGSLPLLRAAVGASVQNGSFLGPKNSMTGPPTMASVGGNGNNAAMAADLWDYSEQCVGEKFEI